jgi:hypothetical protein
VPQRQVADTTAIRPGGAARCAPNGPPAGWLPWTRGSPTSLGPEACRQQVCWRDLVTDRERQSEQKVCAGVLRLALVCWAKTQGPGRLLLASLACMARARWGAGTVPATPWSPLGFCRYQAFWLVFPRMK